MLVLDRLFLWQAKLQKSDKALFSYCLAVFFFAVSNGISTYYFPIIALETGISNSLMGLLYASSSCFGVMFDLLLSKFLDNTNYYRLNIYAFILLIAFPLLLTYSSLPLLLLFGSAIWALYCNFATFADYDFVSTSQTKENHAKGFVTMGIFDDLGYVVAPFLAGIVIMKVGSMQTAVFPVVTGILALIALAWTKKYDPRKDHHLEIDSHPKRSIKEELTALLKVTKKLWPILLLTVSYCTMKAVFWTISPLIDNVSASLKGMGGIVLAISMVPSLFISWSVTPFVRKFGKKRTAYLSFLIANLLLFTVGYLRNPLLIVSVIFLVNLFAAITYPAAGAAIADYLKESTSYDNEILATKDFAGNLGYIIGPLFAGVALDLIGDLRIFSVIAIVGMVLSILALLYSPKSIPFYDKSVK